jgi:uncharacterized membrane protein
MVEAKQRTWEKPWAVWLVVGIATLLRFAWCWNKSLWMDELAAVYIAQYPLRDIIFTTPDTFYHPPLFPSLLNIFIALLGNSRFVWALPSVLAGILSIWLLYDIVRRVANRRVAFWVGMVAAFSPYLIALSQEVFDYMSLLFLALLSWDLLLLCIERNKLWHWIFWGLACVLGFYTHFLMGMVILTQFIAFIFWKPKKRGAWWGLISAGVIAFLLYLPFLYRALTMLSRRSAEIQQWSTPSTLPDIIKKLFGVIYYQLCGFYFSNLNWDKLLSVFTNPANLLLFFGLIVFPVAIILWAFGGLKNMVGKFRLVLLPVLIVPLTMLVYPSVSSRQFILMSPALFMLMGFGVTRALEAWNAHRNILAMILLAGLALGYGFSLVNYYPLEVNQVEQQNWRAIFATIEENEQPGDIIYNHTALTGEAAVRIYYQGRLPRVNSDLDSSASTGTEVTGIRGIVVPIDLWIDELLDRYQRVWFIYLNFEASDFEEMIKRAQAQHPSTEYVTCRDLRLILFER